jgi:hypothetical protein
MTHFLFASLYETNNNLVACRLDSANRRNGRVNFGDGYVTCITHAISYCPYVGIGAQQLRD